MKRKSNLFFCSALAAALFMAGCSSTASLADSPDESNEPEQMEQKEANQSINNSTSKDNIEVKEDAVAVLKEAMEKNKQWKNYGSHSFYKSESIRSNETNISENELFTNIAYQDGNKYSLIEVIKMNSIINGKDYNNSAEIEYMGNLFTSKMNASFSIMKNIEPNTTLSAYALENATFSLFGSISFDSFQQYLNEDIYSNEIENTDDGYTLSFTLISPDKLNDFYRELQDTRYESAKFNNCSCIVKVGKDLEIQEIEASMDVEFEQNQEHSITTLKDVYYGVNKNLCNVDVIKSVIDQAPEDLAELGNDPFNPVEFQVSIPENPVKHQ
ncbi:hypothetical protein [Ileibacterium valens]|uniref:hypothetical protein n=1 Tax=Ileibacterium valens TaxID=1862668 RepID=UPI0025706064|nr:hypothetical protein [Ileibacterium valens]